MNRDAISAIAEVLGVFTVVVTLGYLAGQTRHARHATDLNTRALRSSARIEASRYWSDEVLRLALSPDMALILAKEMKNASPLDPSQRERLIAWYIQKMAATDMLYQQYQEGSLPIEAWQPHEKVLIGFLYTDSFLRVWNAGYIPASDAFRDYINDLMENLPESEWSYENKYGVFD